MKKKVTAVAKRPALGATVSEERISLTIKVDQRLYRRLVLLKANQRSSHQDIVVQAIREYLDRHKDV